ncbi:Uncharacterised protein [Anaerobiospirillum thomasii]|uniref:hypothetical protein n=1 Tax=Anaerobiospirillum thomasii TaxID=179995 RepID=UPI000D8ED3B5|nr:hypothetical protein [Anaerobiospirillum thomasii]SPT67601.1 Uncharacterised protein [Anaerobiospirillum thomasii]SPT71047.1 Uncharacterised protein [Anaerobiospirillum thomasii]SPT71295.1 Uncharacterised protein [Anaerobiospirillum thomasii]
MANQFPEQTNSVAPTKNDYPDKMHSLSERVSILNNDQKHLKELHEKDLKIIESSTQSIIKRLEKLEDKVEKIDSLRWKIVGAAATLVFFATITAAIYKSLS